MDYSWSNSSKGSSSHFPLDSSGTGVDDRRAAEPNVLPSTGMDVAADDQQRLQPIDRVTDGGTAQTPAM